MAVVQVRTDGCLTLDIAKEAGEKWEELALIGGVESVGFGV